MPQLLRLGLAFLLLTGLACSSADEVRAHLAKAEEYGEQGEDEAAVIELKGALAADPQDAEVNFRLAEALRGVGRSGQALYYYSETRRLAPDHLDAYLQAARLIRGADATEAAKLAEAAVELDPSSVEARLLVARLALFRGDEATALKAAERLLVIAPDDPDAHLVLAATLQQQAGRERREEAPDPALLERALAAADRALELSEPNDRWRVLVRRAELLGAWPGREGEAAPVYRAALEATSTRDSTIAVGRAALEYARRQEDAALRAWVLGRIVEAAPNWIRAWEELARLEEEAGGSAEAVYRRMLEADAEEAVAHAAWARFLAREGREAEAAAHLEQTADAGVAPAELLGTLADLHFQQGRREEAVQVVRRLESEHPGAPATERARAQQRIRDGRLAEAETLLRTLPDAQEDAEVLRLLATTLLRQGRPTEALAAAERALELAPGYGRAAALRARIRARTGDWLGVARDLRMVALRSRRLQPGERVLMGRALYELHRPDAAARVLEPLTSGEELFVPAALELARQRADDEPDAAREVLERAHERAPRHPEVLAMLASLDLRAGDAAAARDRLDAAIAEDADAPEVLLTRARLLAYQGDLPEATKDARRAFEAQPGRPEAALLLTKLLGSQGRVGEAIAALDAADEADSLAPRSRLVLARLHAAEGNEARARALLEELHANHPSLPGLANDLAFLVASEGEDLERARALAEQAVEELPEGPDELHTLGYVYLRSGQYELAAMRLQEAVARASAARKENALYHYHLALALRQVHRNESAAQAFERALELDPALPQAVHARAERKAALLGDPAPADPFEGG